MKKLLLIALSLLAGGAFAEGGENAGASRDRLQGPSAPAASAEVQPPAWMGQDQPTSQDDFATRMIREERGNDQHGK